MAEDTTQEGVSTEQVAPMRDDKNPGRQNLRDIYAKQRRMRDEEAEESAGEVPEPEPDAPAAPLEEPETSVEEPPAEQEDRPKEPMVTVTLLDGTTQTLPASQIRLPVKINGEAKDVQGDEAISGYQMVTAGQQKLREANIRLQRAREAEDRVRAAAEAPKKVKETPPKPDDEAILATAEKIRYGNEDEAAKAIEELRALKQVDPGVSDEDLKVGVAQEVIRIQDVRAAQAKAAESYKRDLDQFAEEYEDVVGDDHLRRMAADNVHAVRAHYLAQLGHPVHEMTREQLKDTYGAEQARGTVRSDLDTFRLAGEAVRVWEQNRMTQRTGEDPQPKGFEEKQARKGKTGSPPKPANRRAPAEPEPQKRSSSEVVAQMRRDRQGRQNPHMQR